MRLFPHSRNRVQGHVIIIYRLTSTLSPPLGGFPPGWLRVSDLCRNGICAEGFFRGRDQGHPKLTDRVYMLEGSGGNIGVSVGADGVLIVDDQFAPLADKIRAAIGELGGGDPAFVLNTHYHGDHTGGNAHFGEKGVIVAHRNVRNRLAARRVDDRPLPEAALPEITFDEGLSIHFNGEELRVVHFPKAHTDGDGVVFFTGSNVVHTGDLFFNGRFPYVDLRGGGNVRAISRRSGLF